MTELLGTQRIHIAPVGFEIDRIVIPATKYKADKVYLLVHDNQSEDKALPYIDEIKKMLKKAKIETELINVNFRDVEKITKVVRDTIIKESNSQIFVNIASGSKFHAIALDRACMTFEKRDNIHPFYAEAKTYIGFQFPKQLSKGIKQITEIPLHRIIMPKPEFLKTLDIILKEGGKIKKKTLAAKLEEIGVLKINAKPGNKDQVLLASLDKNIVQHLQEPWKAITVEKIGRNRWISITPEGAYLVNTLI